MSPLHTHQLLAAQTHRRTIDPITFAKRKLPFVTPRTPVASGAPPAPATSPSDPAFEADRVANRRGRC